jgi:hypothetical protein
VLALAKRGEAVPILELPFLSPALGEAYREKTRRALVRDLNLLRKHQLIHVAKRKVTANRAVIEAFLPMKAPPRARAQLLGS